jgi:hypothetical protein
MVVNAVESSKGAFGPSREARRDMNHWRLARLSVVHLKGITLDRAH